ncbi:MAG: tetratricopeptide repeat protein [Acidobacteriota bacterium]
MTLRHVSLPVLLLLGGMAGLSSLNAAATLRARFLDHNNKPLPKVETRLVNIETAETSSREGDKKGEARFENLAPGRYQLYGQRDDFLPAKSEVFVISDQDLEKGLVLPQEKMLRKLESEANIAFENQEYDRALSGFERVLALAPWDPTARSNVMLGYIRLGQGQKARQVARESAAYEPADFSVREKEIMGWIQLEEGKLLLERQQFSQAETALRAAVEAIPGNAEASYALALALGQQGKYSEALKHMDRAIQLKPEDTHFPSVKKILENNARAKGQL